MKQLVHRTVSATNALALPAAEAYSRLPLTLKSHALKGRMNEQDNKVFLILVGKPPGRGCNDRLLFARAVREIVCT